MTLSILSFLIKKLFLLALRIIVGDDLSRVVALQGVHVCLVQRGILERQWQRQLAASLGVLGIPLSSHHLYLSAARADVIGMSVAMPPQKQPRRWRSASRRQ